MGKKRKIFPVRSIVVALIVLSLVFYFISMCLNSLNKEYVESGWKTTTGTILDPNKALQGKKNVERKTQGYEQIVNYEYQIGDLKYRSNSVSKSAFVDIENYPEGKTVNVYYNPTDLTDSVLVRTKVQKQYLYAVLVFCIAIIIVVFYSLVKDFKNI